MQEQIGLFESPTGVAPEDRPWCTGMEWLMQPSNVVQTGLSYAGTGKTLSLICSSLQWLEDRHALEAAEAQASRSSAAGTGWPLPYPSFCQCLKDLAGHHLSRELRAHDLLLEFHICL